MNKTGLGELLSRPRCFSRHEYDGFLRRKILGLLRHPQQDSELRHDQFGLVPTQTLARHVDQITVGVRPADLSQFFSDILSTLVDEERIEIRGPKVRALYGHSLPGVLVGRLEWPTQRLLHVTRAWQATPILWKGLKRRRRSYVHLTTSFEYALKLFEQHPESSLFLEVDPEKLLDDDVFFRKPNSHVWLANRIPPHAIRRITLKKAKRDFANQT